MYAEVGAQAAALLKAAEHASVTPLLPQHYRPRPSVQLAPNLQHPAWLNISMAEPLQRRPILQGVTLPTRETASSAAAASKRSWAAAFGVHDLESFNAGPPWPAHFCEPLPSAAGVLQHAGVHGVNTSSPVSSAVVQLLGMLQAANIKPETLLYVQQLQQLEQLRSAGLLEGATTSSTSTSSYASCNALVDAEGRPTALATAALSCLPGPGWVPTVQASLGTPSILDPSAAAAAALLGHVLKAEAVATDDVPKPLEKISAFEPIPQSEDRPSNTTDTSAKPVCSHLPPELQARLRKKIKIIQPISQTWEAEALKQPVAVSEPSSPPDRVAPVINPLHNRTYSAGFQPVRTLEHKKATTRSTASEAYTMSSPRRAVSQTRSSSHARHTRRVTGEREVRSLSTAPSTGGTATVKAGFSTVRDSSPTSLPTLSEPLASIYTAAGISQGLPTLPRVPGTSAGDGPRSMSLPGPGDSNPKTYSLPPSSGTLTSTGLRSLCASQGKTASGQTRAHGKPTKLKRRNEGQGTSTKTVMDQVRGQLSVLHQWYHASKSMFLEQAEQFLKVLEQPASGSSASSSGKAEDKAVLRAFEKAIQIMQASSEVEQQWRSNSCAQQATHRMQRSDVPSVPVGSGKTGMQPC